MEVITKKHLEDFTKKLLESDKEVKDSYINEDFSDRYVQDFSNVTIETNNLNPIFLQSNTVYRGHGTVFKTTTDVGRNNETLYPGNTADIMTNVPPVFESLVKPHLENIVIDGFVFDGSAESIPGDTMNHVRFFGLYQTDNIVIRNCVFKNSYGSYIVINSCNNVLIENCYFYGGDSCINGDNTSDKSNITIRNCYFDGELFGEVTISEPITMKCANNVLIESNYIKNKKGTCGAMVVKCNKVRMINNTFENIGAALCGARDSVDVDISDNILYCNRYGWHGIGLCGVQGIVARNRIYNAKLNGIVLFGEEFLGSTDDSVSNDILIYDNILCGKDETDNWCNPIMLESDGKITLLKNNIIEFTDNHNSVVTIKPKHSEVSTDKLTYNISIKDNYFNDKKEIVEFDTGFLDRSDVELKLDVARNTGDIKYTNLDNNGFSH